MTARPIIIDTDPGQDDAVAILLALASPQELEVIGITAVAGNVPLALTEKNARRICELAGRPDIKVYAGAERPLILPLQTAEAVHGATGLDGPDLPEPKMQTAPGHAVRFPGRHAARPASPAPSRYACSGRTPIWRWRWSRRLISCRASARS